MSNNTPICCGEVVLATAGGKNYYYCRGCKKEVHENYASSVLTTDDSIELIGLAAWLPTLAIEHGLNRDPVDPRGPYNSKPRKFKPGDKVRSKLGEVRTVSDTAVTFKAHNLHDYERFYKEEMSIDSNGLPFRVNWYELDV